MGGPSADAQRRSLEQGLGGRLGAKYFPCRSFTTCPHCRCIACLVVHTALSPCNHTPPQLLLCLSHTMDENAQPQPHRIQLNPHLAECPDFGNGFHDNLIALLIQPNKTREQVIEDFSNAWHVQNDSTKECWDAQVQADRDIENARNAQAADQGEPAQIVNDGDAIKRRPKLGAFAQKTSVGDEIAPQPSTFAINKLRDMKYVELYCFTPAGCRDHASHITTITPDENLTWEQVRDARACFLSHITYVRWDQVHVNALALFFIKLDNHPFIQTSEGKQALVWYQAHARDDWHRKLGTPESFNIAILNDTLLASFKNKA